ncbi:glycosyltransferase family 2 protein [Frigidibacter sp. ROC022]|uniref:glycosyltransferase family 2 protein n=1 Tax=Frigidibacter sp. ROC022 TaxID=2971796 RepID=UPI00215A9B8C|nr:glycosyltransferase family 2 protein [Frigidibacter sp. ROC022]MCR8725899.1 glycosyltransferase family 2 protein [Frigidibacter sp. ROC022]
MTEYGPGISCIVPAYNEGPRIAAVLSALAAHPQIDEVIVVDDGSTDETAAVAEAAEGVRLIRQWPNGGKTAALATGIAEAAHSHLLFLDADLLGLRASDITALVEPVLGGHAEMAISLRRNAPKLWHWIGIDYISGERALHRDLISDRLDELRGLPRFGFEVWMNQLCLARRARIAVVHWPDVNSPLKARKFGWIAGLRADAGMIADLLRSASPLTLARQIAGMARLRI